MSIKLEPSGRRSVQVEVEVPGSPEEVWRVVATGPGVACWYVPTEVEERIGGEVVFRMGPDVTSTGTVTAWEPPRRFAYEEADWMPHAPPLTTEMAVEPKAGGACLVRLTHSLQTGSSEWDGHLAEFEAGWASHFRILRLYLSRFRGQPCRAFRVTGESPKPETQAWAWLTAALGLSAAAPGRWVAAASAPPLSGWVEERGEGAHPHELLLRLEAPAPGLARLGAYAWGGRTQVVLNCYCYGAPAAAAVGRAEPLWRAWMEERFPAVLGAG